jgi:glyoxylase-like metal-dependent hydrolase (beta-lactamase superfamily II)
MNEVYKNIFQIDIPLYGSPLKLLHAYLIRGSERNLLIDTGFNHETSRQAMFAALKELDVSLDNTDIFLTHVHSDHSGLTGDLQNEKNMVYCSSYDGNYVNKLFTLNYNEKLAVDSKLLGIPYGRILNYDEDSAIAYKSSAVIKFKPLTEKDNLHVGDYFFEVVDLSGHTPGQLGLYEPNHKIMFCGDHILSDITPNIVVWNDDMDSIQVYVNNLRKVRTMDIAYIFSSHRSYITDYKARIDELIKHHECRCREIMGILSNGNKTIYEIAAEMTWDFCDGNFACFPNEQIWYASSEAFAHAEHLHKQGLLRERVVEGTYFYGFQ